MSAVIDFARGIGRRWYQWAFTFFLDPADVYERVVAPMLPTNWQRWIRALNMPPWVFPVALLVGLMLAAFFTYRELHQKVVTESERIRMREQLAEFLSTAMRIQQAIESSKPLDPQRQEYDIWRARVHVFLTETLGPSFIAQFETEAGLNMIPMRLDEFHPGHIGLYQRLNHHVYWLNKFMDDTKTMPVLLGVRTEALHH